MTIRSQIRGFLRAFRSGLGSPIRRHRGHSLAKALRESTHVRGGSMGMGLGRASTERQHEIVAEGHQDYNASFDDEDA